MADVLQPGAVTPLGTSLTTVYTAPSTVRASVTTFMRATNVTASAVTFRLYLIPNAGTAGAGNALAYDFPIAANDFVDFGKGMLLAPLAQLGGSCSVASAVNVKLDVVESS